MFQYNPDVLLNDIIFIVEIIAFESNQHLLLLGAHECLKKELHKVIVVDSLITVFVDLINYSAANELREIEILLGVACGKIVTLYVRLSD